MISLIYSRSMLSDSGSMLVYAMNGPKLTTLISTSHDFTWRKTEGAQVD